MLAIYKQFLTVRDGMSSSCELAPYDWIEHQYKLSPQFIAYGLMLTEHSRELANSINELRRYIMNLEAWDSVLDTMAEKNYDVILEFIEPLATLSINIPYVIRSRFIYSITHLCHQANQSTQKGWKDDLPLDEEIYFDIADKVSISWRAYKKLKKYLEKISNQDYRLKTDDFRNKYNHRYSPKIEIGLTDLVKRTVSKEGKVSYVFGQTEPIKLKNLLPVLTDQHKICINAFAAYQELVNEHISAMNKS